jgi:hypothetical protein
MVVKSMRTPVFVGLIVALAFAVGCGKRKEFEGPTVDAFIGRLVQEGKPVKFPAGEEVELKLFHERGESFGIPIQPDGTFKIGWMPIGKYGALLIREPKTSKAAPLRFNVPGGLTIEEGKTEYTVELGKGYRP